MEMLRPHAQPDSIIALPNINTYILLLAAELPNEKMKT